MKAARFRNGRSAKTPATNKLSSVGESVEIVSNAEISRPKACLQAMSGQPIRNGIIDHNTLTTLGQKRVLSVYQTAGDFQLHKFIN
jgi:hypothetical protein